MFKPEIKGIGSIVLSDTASKSLREILKELNLSQCELAKKTKMSQAWLSHLLTSKPVRDKDALERMDMLLTDHIRAREENQELDPEQAAKYKKTLCSIWDEHRIGKPSFLSAPGRMVPVEAGNCIERFEMQLNSPFKENRRSLTMAVAGPPLSGKTSLLLQLASKAAHKLVDVTMFNCRQPDFVNSLASSIVANMGSIDKPLPENLNQTTFPYWLVKELKGRAARSYLLILDNVADLNAEEARKLFSITYDLDALRALGKLPSNFGVCFSYSYESLKGYQEFSRFRRENRFNPLISTINNHPRIFQPEELPEAFSAPEHPVAVPMFEPTQVKQLLEKVAGNEASQFTDEIFLQYGGHPYLTHLAAAELAYGRIDRNAVEEIFRSAVKGEGQFVDYAETVEKALEPEERKRFREVCDAPGNAVDHEFQNYLVASGLATMINGYLFPASFLIRKLGRHLPVT